MSDKKAEEILNSKKFTVLWSGGKDSTATLLWVLNSISHHNFKVLYVEITGNTDERCNQYVLELAEELGIADKLIFHRTTHKGLDFFQLMERWGSPIIKYRWCLYKLKIPAFHQHIEGIAVSGVRASDSKVRAKFVKPLTYSKFMKTWTVNPLWNWTKQEVLDYLKENGVKLNPCYEKLGHGGNCCFCPYADRVHIIKTMNDPYWREKILTVLEKCKENLLKGEVGRQIYKNWTKYARQSLLIS